MPSIIYNSVLLDEANGAINFGSDAFKVMLVTSAYVPNADTHAKRSDVTGEVSGAGYTAGGNAATASVSAVDTANDRVDVTLGGTTWASSTITAAGAVYYKDRGGAASADEIIAYIDFGGDVVSSDGTFTLNSSTYRKTNSNAA